MKTTVCLALLLALPIVCAAVCTAQENPLWRPYSITPRADRTRHYELNGEWRLGWRDAPIDRVEELANQRQWINARVPATVQMALYYAGELPHPYYNLISEKYKWVNEKVWYYKRSFKTPADAKGNLSFLCFDGVDYFSRVWLNGKLLGRHEGMFGGPAVEVGDSLKAEAQNELV